MSRAFLTLVCCGAAVFSAAAAPADWFAIRAVDEATGRGVPLVELRTVNEQRFVSDNGGWIAFMEPGLMDRETWFHVSAPGYEVPKDGFGFAGVRLVPRPGGEATVRLRRTQPAERIARLTGQGLWRDTALLGRPHPLPNLGAAGIVGQDSVQAVPWKDGVFWLWGDTSVAAYPLGNFHTTCALSDAAPDPEKGIAFRWFMDPDQPQRLRRMMPLTDPGVVWMFGLLVVRDAAGTDRLVAHYGRYPGLAPVLEQGIAAFDEAAGHFRSVTRVDKAETWRFPRGHAVRHGDWFYFSSPLPHTRVRATFEDVCNPGAYEALRWNPESRQWEWQRALPPTTQQDEAALISAGTLPPAEARFSLADALTKRPVRIHGGSVQWNTFRKAWVLIGVESGGKDAPSPLGEVWYAESPAPDGPWSRAVKVASHPRYSFYNPVHHGFMDREDGRLIFFEGTWTAEFSGNPVRTPRWDYNQVIYRLALDNPALTPVALPPQK